MSSRQARRSQEHRLAGAAKTIGCCSANEGAPVIETFGLAHVALKVTDVERSFRFYRRLLGARLLGDLEGRDDEDLSDRDVIEFGTPGCHDVIVLMRSDGPITGDTGQLEHIGFRLVAAQDPAAVAAAFEEAGGTVGSQGHFADGDPY